MRQWKGRSQLRPRKRLWGNVKAMSLILLKLRAVSVHCDVTLKSPVLMVDFLGLQILNIPSSPKIPSSQAQKRDPADDGANISTAMAVIAHYKLTSFCWQKFVQICTFRWRSWLLFNPQIQKVNRIWRAASFCKWQFIFFFYSLTLFCGNSNVSWHVLVLRCLLRLISGCDALVLGRQEALLAPHRHAANHRGMLRGTFLWDASHTSHTHEKLKTFTVLTKEQTFWRFTHSLRAWRE